MENINLIDAASLIIIFVSSALAYFRGLAREILAILSWIVAALLAFVLAPLINPILNDIPFVKEILADSCELSILISFVLGFLTSLVGLSLLVTVITNIIHRSSLSGLDRFLGLCFGAIRGLIIIILVIIAYELFFANGTGLSVVENSRTNEIVFSIKESLKEIMPRARPMWIVNQFNELMTTCEKEILTE